MNKAPLSLELHQCLGIPALLEIPGSTSVRRWMRACRSASAQSASTHQIWVQTLNRMFKSGRTCVSQRITPCGTRTRNLRIRSPTPCPLGQGGCCVPGKYQDLIGRRLSGCYVIIPGQATTSVSCNLSACIGFPHFTRPHPVVRVCVEQFCIWFSMIGYQCSGRRQVWCPW